MLNHYTTKMTGPLETWITHLSFLCFYTGIYSFLYCQNPYFHMKCLFTKIQSNIAIWQYIAIHSNAICNMASTHIVSPLVDNGWFLAVFMIFSWNSLILGQCILGGGQEGCRGEVGGGKSLIKEERRHK